MSAAGAITQVIRGVYQCSGSPHVAFITEAAAWFRLDSAIPAWERDPFDADGGVISHRSAALIHHIGDLLAPKIEFTVPRYRRTRDPMIRFHQAHLDPIEIMTVEGLLPVTTVERTLGDLFAEHLDGGHAADLLTDTFAGHDVNRDNLARRLSPFAACYGATPGNGHALIEDLTGRADNKTAPADSTELAELLDRWQKLAPRLAEADAIAAKLQALIGHNPQKDAAA